MKGMVERLVKLEKEEGRLGGKLKDDLCMVDGRGGRRGWGRLGLVMGWKYLKEKGYVGRGKGRVEEKFGGEWGG